MLEIVLSPGPIRWLVGDANHTIRILGVLVLISAFLLYYNNYYRRAWRAQRLAVAGVATLLVAGSLTRLGAPPFSTVERWIFGVLLAIILGVIVVMGEWLVRGQRQGSDSMRIASVTAIVGYLLVVDRLVFGITSPSVMENFLHSSQQVLEIICLLCLLVLVISLVFDAIDEIPSRLRRHRRRRPGRPNW